MRVYDAPPDDVWTMLISTLQPHCTFLIFDQLITVHCVVALVLELHALNSRLQGSQSYRWRCHGTYTTRSSSCIDALSIRVCTEPTRTLFPDLSLISIQILDLSESLYKIPFCMSAMVVSNARIVYVNIKLRSLSSDLFGHWLPERLCMICHRAD